MPKKKVSFEKLKDFQLFCRQRINYETDPTFDLMLSVNLSIAETFINAMEEKLKNPLMDEFRKNADRIEAEHFIKDGNGKPQRFPIQGNPNAFQYRVADIHAKEEAVEGWLENNKKVKKAFESNKRRREKMLAKEIEVEFHPIEIEDAKKARLSPGAYSLLLNLGILDFPPPPIPEFDDDDDDFEEEDIEETVKAELEAVEDEEPEPGHEEGVFQQ